MNPIFALMIFSVLLILAICFVVGLVRLCSGDATESTCEDDRPRLRVVSGRAAGPPRPASVRRDEEDPIPLAYAFAGDGTAHEHDYSIFVGVPIEDVLSDDAVVLHREAIERWDDRQYEGAKRRLERAAYLAQAELNPVLEARIREDLSNFYFQRGEYQDALRCMTDVLRLAPDVPVLKKRFEEVVKLHARCERFRNASQEVVRLDAEAQRVRNDDEDEAMELAQKAVDHADDLLGPDHWLVAHALITLGCCYFDKGRTLEARDIWNQADTILLEWHDRAPELIAFTEANLRLCRQTLGF